MYSTKAPHATGKRKILFLSGALVDQSDTDAVVQE
jgi:hypothetical protein